VDETNVLAQLHRLMSAPKERRWQSAEQSAEAMSGAKTSRDI
jgi:hypothetical protein